jgi:hypothetical protein
MALPYLFTNLNQVVRHTIHVKAANIKASYVSIKSMMMRCMESHWMTQTQQQIEKNSFGNIFGYKYNALNGFQSLKKEIRCVVTLEFRASTFKMLAAAS